MHVATLLLRKRELRALRLQTIFRGVALVIITASSLAVAATTFERIATSGVMLLYAAFIVLSARWLRRGEKLLPVGLG